MLSFQRLIRFKDESDSIYFGEAPSDVKITTESLIGKAVPVYYGAAPWDDDFRLTGSTRSIKSILCPLERVPIFMCVGLNYKQHADEAGMVYGAYPTIFMKPPDALAGPYEDIPIHSDLLHMDYEAELCVVLGKDCKNLKKSDDVFEYILGYTVGNDVSSRYWQNPERSNNQHATAKSFDKFAPIGPSIVSKSVVPDPTQLHMSSAVNGEARQSTKTDDMIFDIPAIIRHLSRGMTLRKGTVIMTGTPSGVGAFLKPPKWLADGDVVEIGLDEVGVMKNRMVFEKE